jgi:hypothetical protein
METRLPKIAAKAKDLDRRTPSMGSRATIEAAAARMPRCNLGERLVRCIDAMASSSSRRSIFDRP